MGTVVWYQERHDRQRILCTTLITMTKVIITIRTNDGVRWDAFRIGYSCASELWVSLSCTTASIALWRDSTSCESLEITLKLVGALYLKLGHVSKPPRSWYPLGTQSRPENSPPLIPRDPGPVTVRALPSVPPAGCMPTNLTIPRDRGWIITLPLLCNKVAQDKLADIYGRI